MKHRRILLVISLILLGAFTSYAQKEDSKTEDATALAQTFVQQLATEDFQNATKTFDAGMLSAVPLEQLRFIWKTIIMQAGPFKKQLSCRKETSGSYEIIYVTCEFEKAPLDVKIAYNRSKQISGLFFVPSQPAAEYKSPSYSKPDAFSEKEVMIGTGEWAVHGTLTMPSGKGPFPTVILVHGSGPNDRDESIGPNKPFRDLALGLSSNNVAVLRYEKRTKEHGMKFASYKDGFTVKEEVLDDVALAVSLLKKTEGVDAKRIFVLGHSLGGMLIPRIGKLDTEIAGLIVMAGPTRPLEDLMIEQFTYIFSLDGGVSEFEQSQLDKIKQEAVKIKDPKLSEAPPTESVLGIPAKYWLDLRGYYPSESAKELKQPLLILQGERDYQVTMEDFKNWQKALAGRGDVKFKSYPKLNHLFIEGEGKSAPTEYQVFGNVAQYVIGDIAEWVRR